MDNKIGKFELKLYYFIWISTNLHALFKLWHSQNEIMNSNSTISVADLEKGWIIQNYVDNSDLEWITWKYYLKTSFIYLMLQYLVSETIRTIYSPFLMYWYIMSSISFIGYIIGIMHLGFALALPIIYAVIILTTRNKLYVWTTSIFLLLFYNYLKQNPIFWDHFSSGSKDEDVYMILFAYGWIELRCISFTLDNIDKRGKSTKSKPQKYHDILNMFAYVMYLPLFFNGPHILYDDFEKGYTTSKPLYKKLRWFTMNIAIFLIYMFLLELSFHYIYFLALKENIELIKDLPTIALCGGGLWMGLEFHMKYVISYGMSGAFALLDNIDPPPTPRCIARIHVYSQMWRYFDVGLYKFLIKYIYKPCLTFITKYSIFPKSINKLLASLSTFLFILMWHGTIKEIFIWAALNFIGITCENMAEIISNGSWYCNFKNRILKTDAMEQRFIALLCAPLLAVSAVSNFYLFAGLNVGNLFVEKLCPPSFYTFTVLLISLYSCCQVSITLKDLPSRTIKTV